jgi:hypothetical protein
MPWLLKLITLNAASGLAMAAATAFVSIDAGGRKIPPWQWWSSGAGPILLLAMVPLFVSAYLMLRRSPKARTCYLSGFAFLALISPIVWWLAGMEIAPAIPGLLLCLVLILGLGLYLYLDRGVRDYFGANPRS